MQKTIITAIIAVAFLAAPALAYQSLQELFEQAEPYGGYDRYIELDPSEQYIGDLWIDTDVSVRLIGNGALVHGGVFAISVMYGRLNISGCVIVGGYEGLFYSTNSSGEIYNNTITSCQNYGISVIYPDDNEGVQIWDNIITDCYYGIFCIEDHHPDYIGYNTIWNTVSFRYAEQCLD